MVEATIDLDGVVLNERGEWQCPVFLQCEGPREAIEDNEKKSWYKVPYRKCSIEFSPVTAVRVVDDQRIGAYLIEEIVLDGEDILIKTQMVTSIRLIFAGSWMLAWNDPGIATHYRRARSALWGGEYEAGELYPIQTNPG